MVSGGRSGVDRGNDFALGSFTRHGSDVLKDFPSCPFVSTDPFASPRNRPHRRGSHIFGVTGSSPGLSLFRALSPPYLSSTGNAAPVPQSASSTAPKPSPTMIYYTGSHVQRPGPLFARAPSYVTSSVKRGHRAARTAPTPPMPPPSTVRYSGSQVRWAGPYPTVARCDLSTPGQA